MPESQGSTSRAIASPLLGLIACAIVSSAWSCGGTPVAPEDSGPGAAGPAGLVPLQVPRWVQDPYALHDKRRFITGVGAAPIAISEGEAQQEADERARGQIVLALQARVQQEVDVLRRSEERFENAGATTKTQLELRDLTRVVGSGVLDGAEIVQRASDPSSRTFYSLAVMERAVAARNLDSRIASILDEADAQLALAESSPRVRSLGPLLRSYELYLEARVAQATRSVLAGGEPSSPRDRGAEVRARLEGFLGDLAIEVVRGQNQRGSVGAPLREPIEIRVTLADGGRQVPVAGVSMSVRPRFPQVTRVSAESITTNDAGLAVFTVPLVQSTGEGNNSIRVALEASRIGTIGDRGVDILYSLPTRDTINLLVYIEESNLGREQPESMVATKIKSLLRTRGFPVVDTKVVGPKVSERELLELSSHDLEQRIGNEVDVVVRGRASTRPTGGSLGGNPVVEGTLEIEALDLRSGRVVLTNTRSEKAAKSTPDAAGRESLSLLAGNRSDDAPALIVKRLAEVLGGKK